MAGSGAPRVLISPKLEAACGHGDGAPCFFTMSHPATGDDVTYLATASTICEVNVHKPSYTSWFVGDSVVEDGSTYLATPMDPLFLILPALERACTRGFCDTETLLEASGLPPCCFYILAKTNLDSVCSSKAVMDQKYYQLDETKTLNWLKTKVENTKNGLRSLRSLGWADAEEGVLLPYAVGLVCEYLPPHRVESLRTYLNVGMEPASPAVAGMPYPVSEVDTQPKRKKLTPAEAAKLKAAESRQLNKAAKAAKEAAGTRKLSGFFKPRAGTNQSA
ncbi:hypothetical protein ACKKBG_A28420 [Auxenochlorella protothecoides x Auxenochlorella symbiontica]